MRWYIILCLLLVLPIVYSDTSPIIVECTDLDQPCQLDLYDYVKEYELLLYVDELYIDFGSHNFVIDLIKDKSGYCEALKDGTYLMCNGKAIVEAFNKFGGPTFNIVSFGKEDIEISNLGDLPVINMYSTSEGKSLVGILQNMHLGKSYAPEYTTSELALESFSSDVSSEDSSKDSSEDSSEDSISIDIIDYEPTAGAESEHGSFCSEFSSIESCFLGSDFSDLCSDPDSLDLTELEGILSKTEDAGGSLIFNFDGESGFVDGITHSVFFDAFPDVFLPFQSYMAALTFEEDGSITSVCDYRSDLEEQGADLYVLLFDYSSTIYGCSGEFLIYGKDGGSNAYSLPGTKSCITDLRIGTYDVDGDGEYTLTDALRYVFWVMKHRVLGYDTPVYPLAAEEIDVESTVWG